MLANQNFDKLVQIISQIPILTPEKVQRIIERRNKLKNVPYNYNAKFENEEDNEIYGL